MNSPALRVLLADEAATLEFGRLLALSLPKDGPCPALLLDGDLGAGKTTLVRGLVSALPGGPAAEVSSPSFNIMNLYPTEPETAHFDLYRLEGMVPEEELQDSLDSPGLLTVIEWSQRLEGGNLPEDRLVLKWVEARGTRLVALVPTGEDSEKWVLALGRALDKAREVSPSGCPIRLQGDDATPCA